MRVKLFATLALTTWMAATCFAQETAPAPPVIADEALEVPAPPTEDNATLVPAPVAGCCAPACDTNTTCGSGCGSRCGGILGCCCLGEEWKLQPECGWAACRGIEWGGWLEAGFYSNAWGAKRNGPLTMRNYANGATFDQLWLYAEKAADNGGCGLAFGGRADFVFGADGPDTQCFNDGGWDGQWISSKDGNYGSALPQLYGEVAYNNLSVKIGHFYTVIGYEVVPATGNFFYSHSYSLAYEPFTHTGAIATYKVNDNISFTGGWVNGCDNGWLNPTGASTFIGGVNLQLTQNSTLAYALATGYNQATWLPGNSYMHSIVFDWQINDCWEYVFQSDYGNADLDGNWTQFISFNQYLFREINDCWKVGMRLETLHVEGNAGADIQQNNFTEVTFGFNYKPHANVVIRPEIRWDATGGDNPFVFDNDTKNHQFAGGLDVIFTY